MARKMVWMKDYDGFESLSDLGRDLHEAFEYSEQFLSEVPAEFTGKLTVTLSYDPDDS